MLGQFFSSAFKHYRRAPMITAVNVIGLALGLACFLAAWAMSSYWQRSDSNFANADRTYILTQQYQIDGKLPRAGVTSGPVPARYLREDMPELEAVGRMNGGGEISMAYEGKSIALVRAIADPEIFDIFDFDFIYGSGDQALVTPENIVMTQKAAEKLFGKVNPVGRSVISSGETRTVVGVIAQIAQPSHMGDSPGSIVQFDYLEQWPKPSEGDREWWLSLSGLTYMLLPKDNTAAIKDKLDRTLTSFSDRHIPKVQQELVEKIVFGTMSLPELQSRNLDAGIFQNQPTVVSVRGVLFGMGLIILLVSCINYANLATAQAAGYAKEVGLRKVVGASRSSVMLQYWLEALLLVVLGGLAATIILALSAPILKARTGINLLDSLWHTPFFLPTFLGLIVLVSILASLYPVAFLSRVRPVEALRSGKIKSGNGRLTQFLVGTQFAVASALLILVLVVGQQNQFVRDSAINPDKDPVVVLSDNGSVEIGPSELREALSNERSIKSVSASNYAPWSENRNYSDLTLSEAVDAATVEINTLWLGYDFIPTFQITLLAGRSFDREIEAWGEPAREEAAFFNPNETESVIIDDNFRKALGFETPEAAIGQNLYLAAKYRGSGDGDPTWNIIGVVDTIPFSFGATFAPSNLYRLSTSIRDKPVIRIDKNNVKEGVAAIEKVVKARAPDNAVIIKFTDQEFERNFKTYEGINTGFTGLSLIALVISSMGLFAMAVFTAIQRRQEIGIRKTLGASTWEVMSLLIKDFSRPVVIANIVAWPLAWYAANTYLKGFTQHINLTPIPWILGFVFTLFIAWLAVGGQAFSAARVKPAEVLKSE